MRLDATLILICLAIYARSFDAEFAYDDHHAIVGNVDVVGQQPISRIWFADFWGVPLNHSLTHKSWRPATVLLFRVIYLIFGATATAFHTLSLVAHCIVTVIVFHLAPRIGLSKESATSAALLFAVHPVHAGTALFKVPFDLITM